LDVSPLYFQLAPCIYTIYFQKSFQGCFCSIFTIYLMRLTFWGKSDVKFYLKFHIAKEDKEEYV